MFGKKNNKKVLCVCHYGINRSKFLADFLENKGYETRYGGVSEGQGNSLTQEDADWAEVIVFAREYIKEIFEKNFKLNEQKLVTLEVTDNPVDLKDKSNFVWEEYQELHTYPELKKQIKEHLPL